MLTAALAAAPVAAHDFWIEPSTFHPADGETVTVGLRAGQSFVGDAVLRSGTLINRFFVRQGGRDESVVGLEGKDPAGFLSARAEETIVIAYQSQSSFIELPAAKFEEYLRQEGLDQIVAARGVRGSSGAAGREYFTRYAKALLTGRRSATAVTTPIGFELEIVPEIDPTQDGGPFRGRVLYRGQPLSGALVVAMPRAGLAARLTTHSDGQGRFTLSTSGGTWLIKSVHMIEASWFSRADWQSLWASLTFDAPAKAVPASASGS